MPFNVFSVIFKLVNGFLFMCDIRIVRQMAFAAAIVIVRFKCR